MDVIHPASNSLLLAVNRGGPGDDKAWAEARRSAMTLAESGNLLIMRNRAAAWVADARLLTDAGTAAYRAAGQGRPGSRRPRRSHRLVVYDMSRAVPPGRLSSRHDRRRPIAANTRAKKRLRPSSKTEGPSSGGGSQVYCVFTITVTYSGAEAPGSQGARRENTGSI